MKKIYVDADACPVKEEIIKVATRHQINVLMVCNGGIRPFKSDLIKLVIVAEGSDEADKWIYENICDKDIVITALVINAVNILYAIGGLIALTGLKKLLEKKIYRFSRQK